MKTSLISIIIPVYNVEKYLRQCLDSVLSQTYTNYEVIMVDDGSTDSSRDICDAYNDGDERFQVIHQNNKGLSVARNTGFQASTGAYIYFLDSDDWIEKTTLEKLIFHAEETDADFVFFDGKSFEDSKKGYRIRQGYLRKRKYPIGSGIEVFDALQQSGDFKSAVPTYLWKRSFLLDNQMSFYPGILYEDMIFSFEAFCKAQRVAHCYEALYHRRIRANSIMTAKPNAKSFISWCTAYSEVTRIAKETDSPERPSFSAYIARVSMRALDVYAQLSASDKKEQAEKYRRLKNELKKANWYNSKALYFRTYGKLPWVMYKAFQKITRS